MKRLHETEAPTEIPTTSTDAYKEKRANKYDCGISKDADSEDDSSSSDCGSDNVVLTSSSNHFPTRLGKCEVCAGGNARYSCPKCEVKTCSLRCVQIHKKELDCDGIRDRTKFIPLRKMTKMDFMSDYYFLEECTRYVNDRKNDTIKRFTRYNKTLPTHLFRLRGAAAERRTLLRFLLPNFTRHKNNTTFYDWNLRKIYWRIEWIFINAGALQYVDERCDEDFKLAQLLDKYINIQNAESVPQKKALEYYQSTGFSGLKLLLKAEGIKSSRTRYYALDVRKTLKENLAGKTLVEFPCIYVSYEQNPAGCDIVDSDEDVEAETKRHEAAMEALHKQRLAENSIKSENADAYANEKQAAREAERLANALAQKRREARARKREEFQNAANNLLFSDEQLWEMLTSSSSGDDTEEENIT
ncbi:PREDICTED: box C/D snoRNA protein 1-like isoform X2 [Rhagoletis zephyria]|uniref:box C/D snoRNA protein 1-like isoform X2 n=1 Tax=Rhagoletis zephyria TaxID=28612 RepID=UPI0008113C00|nr:PREDICTED: box C/D snoRNA protein 1-like isoform X2 [Rhagoletis zephyria]